MWLTNHTITDLKTGIVTQHIQTKRGDTSASPVLVLPWSPPAQAALVERLQKVITDNVSCGPEGSVTELRLSYEVARAVLKALGGGK